MIVPSTYPLGDGDNLEEMVECFAGEGRANASTVGKLRLHSWNAALKTEDRKPIPIFGSLYQRMMSRASESRLLDDRERGSLIRYLLQPRCLPQLFLQGSSDQVDFQND